MIVDIPEASDFEQAGDSMLNLGWDSVAALYRDVDNAGIAEWDEDASVSEEYWHAAKHPIAVALALVQQGIELLLKAEIVRVSPFLLVAGSPREWPSGCDRTDTPFADFRSIDSHELLRAHDTVARRRLSVRFRQQFERLRRVRNVILHGVDKRLRPSGSDVFRTVLEVEEELLEPRGRFRRRRRYLAASPLAVAYGGDIEILLVSEAETLVSLLKPAEAKRYLGLNKRVRCYTCSNCASECRDAGLLPKTAQLLPVGAESSKVFCFVCEKTQPVERQKCKRKGCRGDVMEEGRCLTCDEDATDAG